MNAQPGVERDAQIRGACRNLRRRIFAAVLLGALTLAAPAIAAAAPAPHWEVRMPRLDRRAIENLQRWVSAGHDTWCREPQPVASEEMKRIAPEFAGYKFDLVSLPLETQSHATQRAVCIHTSLVKGQGAARSFSGRHDMISSYSRVRQAKIVPATFSRPIRPERSRLDARSVGRMASRRCVA